MKCDCGKRAVALVDGRFLCREHFTKWLEGEVRRELEKFVEEDDILAVAVSGGKDSTTLLKISHEWSLEKGIKIFAILIDEGIRGYRDKTRKFLEEFCRNRGIELFVFEFKREFGKTLDELLEIRNKLNLNLQACTICGTFRRYLLNKYARELGATKVLFAHNLDDEVQTFFMNLFTANLGQMSRKGEIVGIINSPLFVPRFKPLIKIPEKYLAIYSLLSFPSLPEAECPYLRESMRFKIRKLLFEIEKRKRGARKNILKIYLEKIVPALKAHIKKFQKPLKKCKICGEPSSGEICKACELRVKLRIMHP